MRRPFRRRPLRRSPARGPGAVPPLLRQANALARQGRHAEALILLERLLARPGAAAHPRTPALKLQAGRAAILAGQTETGLGYLRAGLQEMAARGQWAALERHIPRVTEGLEQAGMAAAAAEMEAWARALFPAEVSAVSHPTPAGQLPTHCVGCGAPVNPRETEWLDARTAECPYCGTPLHAE